MSWQNLKVILYPLSFYTKEMHSLAKKFLDSLYLDEWKYVFLVHLCTKEFTLLWSQSDLLKVDIRDSCMNKIYPEMIKLQEYNYFNIRYSFPWMPLPTELIIGLARHGLNISCYFGYEWVIRKYKTYFTRIVLLILAKIISPQCCTICSVQIVYLAIANSP